MACSKYISTEKTTNAVRVSLLIIGPCTDLLRDILRNHVYEINFPSVLTKDKNKLLPLLNKVQKETLYPKIGRFQGTYQNFDLSLLYALLRNISGIVPHQKGWGKPPDPSDRSLSANIDRIREIRNTYCGHTVNVSLSDEKLKAIWNLLTTIIGELEKSVYVGLSTYSDAAKRLKTETMDPEQEKRYLCIISTQSKIVDEIKEESDRTSKGLKDLTTEVREGQRVIMHTHEKHAAKLDDLKPRLQRIEEHVERLADTEGTNMLENTKVVLRMHRCRREYTRTSAVKSTIKKLKHNGIAILTGKAGSGKTTTAYQILCEISEEPSKPPYIPVLLESSKQWNKIISSSNRYVVFIDDIFGSTNLDKILVEEWKKRFDYKFSAAKGGRAVVIVGLRRNILEEARNYCTHEVLGEKNVIDLSSRYKIKLEEKLKMLNSFLENHERSLACRKQSTKPWKQDKGYILSDQEIKRIISEEPYYGFPLTCFLFFSREEFFELGHSFFKHTNTMLYKQVEDMRKFESGRIKNVAYCILSYIFINGNIDTQDMLDDLFKTICEKIRLYDVSDIDIVDALDYLDCKNFIQTTANHVYGFSHETVLESILVSFGNIDPEVVIMRCRKQKLFELIRTCNYISKPGEIVLKVPKRCFGNLARRLMCGDDGDGCINEPWRVATGIAWHPVSDDPEFAIFLLNCDYFQIYRMENILLESVGNKSLHDYLLDRIAFQGKKFYKRCLEQTRSSYQFQHFSDHSSCPCQLLPSGNRSCQSPPVHCSEQTCRSHPSQHFSECRYCQSQP